MKNSGKIAFGSLLLLVLLLTYLEASEPEPVNWNPSYLETDKIALGSFVFYESWKETLSNPLETIDVPPFEFLTEAPDGTYFFLNNSLGFDDSELGKLLTWVNRGNTVFLSANSYSGNLLDSLKVEISTRMPGENFSSMPILKLINSRLPKENFRFEHETPLAYFSKIDTLNQTVLGIANIKEFKEPSEAYPNFLKANWGDGTIFIHTTPQAFSNYFLLSAANYKYAEGVLAYLKTGTTVYWDRYYKTGKTFYSSPLYILLQSKPLKWAYYFLLAGSVLFIIFEGKRKQRPVPVVEPLKNQTYEYSKTIADLYLEQKEFKALALKKIDHFNDYIRQQYRIDTSHFDEKFYQELAEKSNHTIEETKELYQQFGNIKNKSEISKTELQALNDSIKSFKQPL